MLPVELQTPPEIGAMIAERAKALRIARGWSQQELADRASVAVDTLRRFERTGQVSLDRLLRIAMALDAIRAFGELFAPPPVRTLAELESAQAPRKRAPRSRRPRA